MPFRPDRPMCRKLSTRHVQGLLHFVHQGGHGLFLRCMTVNQHVADMQASSAFLALQHVGQPEMQPERREELF